MKGLVVLSSPGVAPINPQWKRVRRKESKSPRPPLDPMSSTHPRPIFVFQLHLPSSSLCCYCTSTVGESSVGLYSSSSLTNLSIACSSASYPLLCAFSSSQIPRYHPTSFSNPSSTGNRQPLAGQSHNHLKFRLSHETGTSSSASKSHWPGEFAEIMNRA